jgi:hypothetical protein
MRNTQTSCQLEMQTSCQLEVIKADAMVALQLPNAELLQQQAAAALDICIQHHLAAEDIARLWCSSRSLQQL